MKRKRKIQWLLAALLLTGCCKDSTEVDNLGGEGMSIQFATEVETKATVTTQRSIADFGVYAYMTENKPWAEVGSATQSNWIDHKQIIRQDNYWIGPQTFYWPVEPAKKLSFFAYSPYATSYNGITMPQGATSNDFSATGIPQLAFEVSQDIPTQVDLLVAAPHYDITNAQSNKKVVLSFKHTMSKIGFQAFCPSPGTAILSITLTHLPSKGNMPIDGNNRWTIDRTSIKEFMYYLNGIILSENPVKPTNLSEPAGYFLFFPQQFDASSNSDIVVTILTPEGNEITQRTPILENWEMGKSILYTLQINAEKTEALIVKEVTITDWKYQAGSDQTVDTKGKYYPVTLDPNGGSLTAEQTAFNKTYEYGSMPKIPSAQPNFPGKTFKEWNTDASGCGTAYSPGTRIKVQKGITLYAIWS